MRHLQITLMHLQDRLIRHFYNFFSKTSTIYLANLFKMSFRFAFETSFGHLQDILTRCFVCVRKTSLRHLVDVFLTTWSILAHKNHQAYWKFFVEEYLKFVCMPNGYRPVMLIFKKKYHFLSLGKKVSDCILR